MCKVTSICSRLCSHYRKYSNIYPRKLLVSVFQLPNRKYLIGIPVIPVVAATSNVSKTENEIVPSTAELVLSKEEQSPEVENESGWDRVRAVFHSDEYGNHSKELNATINAVFMGGLGGAVYGGVKASRIALHDFMDRNQATIYENHIDAKRRLQNHVTIHFGKGAIRWGLKVSAFTGGFMLIITTMLAYRGHTSLLDYTVGGVILGGLFRLKHGPRFFVVGSVLGGILGFMCGLSTKILLNAYGATFDEVLAFQYEADQKRKKIYSDALRSRYEGGDSSPEVKMLKEHNKLIEEKGLEPV